MNYNNSTFEDIKHLDKNNNEYWEARELQLTLGYLKWENFHKVIKQAMISCQISQQSVSDCFLEVRKPIISGKGRQDTIVDYRLSRYACYLIVMNGDPRKEIIAQGQTYFAVKTREQEMSELFTLLTEDDKRLYLRYDIKQKNMMLAEAAHKAGITTSFDYAHFQDSGYMGLYGGEKAKDIAARKNLSNEQDILDYMGANELAANLFRITQTEDKMKRENIQGIEDANTTHYNVGKIVREAIEKTGGTMPENLPTPDKNIKELEKTKRKKLNK